jgi:hypothetical protein
MRRVLGVNLPYAATLAGQPAARAVAFVAVKIEKWVRRTRP